MIKYVILLLKEIKQM